MGQNFLRDRNVLRKIIVAAHLSPQDIVLEVGPGEGILTEALAQAAGRVIAVEKDRKLAMALKEKFAGAPNIIIIQDDILKFLDFGIWNLFENWKLEIGNYKVVANIPYYLTSHLIRLLLESPSPPQDIILMIQKEVAQRVCALPPQMSLLAASVQFYAQPKIVSFVSKRSFWPQPKVDSAIIRITPHRWCHPEQSEGSRGSIATRATKLADSSPTAQNDKINNECFFRILRAGFSHPRKQLLNNLSRGLKIPKDKTATALQSAGLSPQQRAETLSVEDWIKLSNLFFSKKSR